MRRPVYLVGLLLVLAGCADESPIEPDPDPRPDSVATVDPVGTYTLALVDTLKLPADMRGISDCSGKGGQCVTKGALVVQAGGSYALSYEWTTYYATGGVDQIGSASDFGKWTARDSTVTFTSAIDSTRTENAPTVPRTFKGRARATELATTFRTNLLTFRK